MSSANINNLNVFTFIKDIYQSLKHIDQYFSKFNDSNNLRLTKLENNQNAILDKLANIEILLIKSSDINRHNNSLDKALEKQLLEKISNMNSIANIDIMNGNSKIGLQPDELTFANIIENGYNLLDINNCIGDVDINNNIYSINNKNDMNDKNETLDTLLF